MLEVARIQRDVDALTKMAAHVQKLDQNIPWWERQPHMATAVKVVAPLVSAGVTSAIMKALTAKPGRGRSAGYGTLVKNIAASAVSALASYGITSYGLKLAHEQNVVVPGYVNDGKVTLYSEAVETSIIYAWQAYERSYIDNLTVQIDSCADRLRTRLLQITANPRAAWIDSSLTQEIQTRLNAITYPDVKSAQTREDARYHQVRE